MATTKKAAAKKTPAKAAKKTVPANQKNGISQPKPGGDCAAIWNIASTITAQKKRTATRAEVMEAALKKEFAEGTVATQYQRWKKFHGISGRVSDGSKPAAKKAVKAPAKKAAKKPVKKAAAKKAAKPKAKPVAAAAATTEASAS
jgi:hypothetical protein